MCDADGHIIQECDTQAGGIERAAMLVLRGPRNAPASAAELKATAARVAAQSAEVTKTWTHNGVQYSRTYFPQKEYQKRRRAELAARRPGF